MLPIEYKAQNYHEWNQERWDEYFLRLGLPDDEAKRQFFRQVVYDHFEHHNNHYPDFEIEDYEYSLIQLSVSEVREKVRFFPGPDLSEMWGLQYDDFEKRNYPYPIYQEMSKNKTPPFPPIILDSSNLKDNGWRVYGRPIHLIEGTHRTSYLLRMAERNVIGWESKHDFVLLTPKST